MDYYSKYLKYKNKYIELKRLLGGNSSNIIEADKPYYTNYISIHANNYYNLNIYSYYINSSHNTYLPFDQVKGVTSVCYYKLQAFTYFSGCFEIDTIRKENDDIIITHLPTNKNTLKLSSILKVIVEALKLKIKRGIVSGPIILTFDNKGLRTKEDYTVFWNVIKKNVPEDMIQEIKEDYNLRKIPISEMSSKILFRWGENKHCDNECKSKDILSPAVINQKFSYIKNKDRWIHILKGNTNYKKEISSDSNKSVSTNAPKIDSYFEPNVNLILNTQRNILRMYPHWSNILSDNYKNIKYYRNGGQIIALNLQSSSDSVLLNNAIFIKEGTKFCTPNQVRKGELCEKGAEDGVPISYRLKPLWLLGLLPYPDLYNLEIQILDIRSDKPDITKYKNLTIIIGENLKSEIYTLKKPIFVKNIDVTVPFFIFSLQKSLFPSESYKNGCEIEWSIENVNQPKTKTITLYKTEKTKLKFNDLSNDINENDRDSDCNNSKLLTVKSKIDIHLKFIWREKDFLIKNLNSPKPDKASSTITTKSTNSPSSPKPGHSSETNPTSLKTSQQVSSKESKSPSRESKSPSRESKSSSRESKSPSKNSKNKKGSTTIEIYNRIITELRNSDKYKGKTIVNFLSDLILLNNYQDDLIERCKYLLKKDSFEPNTVQTDDDVSTDNIKKEI